MMLNRLLQPVIEQRLAAFPAVALLGPRQVGKTTLARAVAAARPGTTFLDLERAADRAALACADLLLPTLRQGLVVIDEVQQAPDLFAALRPEIDADRRAGRFLLLGSASGALLKQSAESLAGRIAHVELTPFLAAESAPDLLLTQSLWLRGGYPLSWLAPDDATSFQWRLEFLQTFLQRDLPALGVRTPAEAARRLWTMLAHLQGQPFNASQLGQALGGASHTTVARWVDVLVDTMMVRRLEPFLVNVGKRLVKSPRLYLRDSGLLHALLGVPTVHALQGHPIAGASWEGFVVEEVAAALPPGAQLGYYRTAAGAEVDVVVEVGSTRVVLEVKLSSAPKPARGFWQALRDLGARDAWVVAPVPRAFPLAEGVTVIPPWEVRGRVGAVGA